MPGGVAHGLGEEWEEVEKAEDGSHCGGRVSNSGGETKAEQADEDQVEGLSHSGSERGAVGERQERVPIGYGEALARQDCPCDEKRPAHRDRSPD